MDNSHIWLRFDAVISCPGRFIQVLEHIKGNVSNDLTTTSIKLVPSQDGPFS